MMKTLKNSICFSEIHSDVLSDEEIFNLQEDVKGYYEFMFNKREKEKEKRIFEKELEKLRKARSI